MIRYLHGALNTVVHIVRGEGVTAICGAPCGTLEVPAAKVRKVCRKCSYALAATREKG